MRRIVLVMLLGLVSVAGVAAGSTGDEACWDLTERGADERCTADVGPSLDLAGAVDTDSVEAQAEVGVRIAVTCRVVADELTIGRRLPCPR